MRTIAEIFNLPRPETQSPKSTRLISINKVGVEVEVENLISPPNIRGWRLERDGSLRNNGYEYVFHTPVGGQTAIDRLRDLEESLKTIKPQIQLNERGSVHVHVDVRDLTWEQAMQMFLLYLVVESYLFNLCGKGRDDNIYSLALYKGEDQIDKFKWIYQNGARDENLNEDTWTKYSAINLIALKTFGSIEFRGHEATIDSDRIVNWINHLLHLKEFVLDSNKDVNQLPYILSNQGPIELLKLIFGDLAPSEIDPKTEKKLYKSVWLCEDIIYQKQLIKAEADIFKSNHK